jgi:hypothetical protein
MIAHLDLRSVRLYRAGVAKKRKSAAKGETKRSAALSGPLAPAIDTFSRGDYVSARRMFDEAMQDKELSEENRQVAKALRASLGIDKTTLLTGLACIGLYLLVILVAILKQP